MQKYLQMGLRYGKLGEIAGISALGCAGGIPTFFEIWMNGGVFSTSGWFPNEALPLWAWEQGWKVVNYSHQCLLWTPKQTLNHVQEQFQFCSFFLIPIEKEVSYLHMDIFFMQIGQEMKVYYLMQDEVHFWPWTVLWTRGRSLPKLPNLVMWQHNSHAKFFLQLHQSASTSWRKSPSETNCRDNM